MNDEAESTDYAEVTERQRETWATGDFNEIARLNVGMAEALVNKADPHAGQPVFCLWQRYRSARCSPSVL